MAVAVQLPPRNHPVFLEPKLGSLPLQSLSWPMIASMSYQYPPPPQDGAEMDLPHAGYLSSYATPSASSMEVRNRTAHPPQPPSPAQDILMPLAPRRHPVQKPFKLRRAFSNPNVRKQGANDPDNGHLALSSSEKRRNKLGYHRTSVACGMFYAPAPALLAFSSSALLTPLPKAIADVERSGASSSLLTLAVDA